MIEVSPLCISHEATGELIAKQFCFRRGFLSAVGNPTDTAASKVAYSIQSRVMYTFSEMAVESQNVHTDEDRDPF